VLERVLLRQEALRLRAELIRRYQRRRSEAEEEHRFAVDAEADVVPEEVVPHRAAERQVLRGADVHVFGAELVGVPDRWVHLLVELVLMAGVDDEVAVEAVLA